MSEESKAPTPLVTFSIAARDEWEALFDPTPPLSGCPFGRALCEMAQTLLPGEAEGILNTLAYAANELVDNALRFNVEGTLTLRCGLMGQQCFCTVGNIVHNDIALALRAHLVALEVGNLGDLLRNQVESTIGTSKSGLGYLTLLHDYGVRLGWAIEPYSSELVRLWVTAYLPTTKGVGDGN